MVATLQIEVAKRLTPDATFSVAMAEALPLADASVDLALSTSSFHHWQNQAAGVREIARVLRPGGYVILEDASFPDWLVRLLRMKRFHSPAQLQTLFTDAELQATLQHHDERIAHLFRKNDPDSDSDWATGLLRRHIKEQAALVNAALALES